MKTKKYAKPYRFETAAEKEARHKAWVKKNGYAYFRPDHSKKAKLAWSLGDLMLVRKALVAYTESLPGKSWQAANSAYDLKNDVQVVITNMMKKN